MREIRFRAWHDEHKTMVSFNNRKLTSDEYQRAHLAMLLAGDYGDVLMQFTGLQDKNDTDIYEGDILKDPYIERSRYDSGEILYGIVEFDEALGAFVAVYGDLFDCVYRKTAHEVIGNIYQNPELLGVEQ